MTQYIVVALIVVVALGNITWRIIRWQRSTKSSGPGCGSCGSCPKH